MKRIFSTMLVTFVMFALSSVIAGSPTSKTKNRSATKAVRAVPYCVRCGWSSISSECRACVSGGDSDECLADCVTCTVGGGRCGGDGPPIGDPPGGIGFSRFTQPIKIDNSTIREIAQAHPRFAATLALQNKNQLAIPVTTHWTPVELTARDVEAFLTDSPEALIALNKINKRAKKINRRLRKGELTEIVYTLSVEAPDQITRVLKLQVNQASPVEGAYSTLTIRMWYSGMESLTQKAQKPVRTEWEIN